MCRVGIRKAVMIVIKMRKAVSSAPFFVATLMLCACGREGPETLDVAASSVAPAVAAARVESRPVDVFWGDQHVHTSYSGDAAAVGTVVSPEDAVRFARGEIVRSNTGQDAQLLRPLDWVAITDHSDAMGVISEVQRGNPEMLVDATVRRWHDGLAKGGQAAFAVSREIIAAQASKSLPAVVTDPRWAVSVWGKSIDTMEKYNEPGRFTAFIAFEWTSNGEVGQNLHRNVIFRDGAASTRDYPPLTTFESSVPGRAGTDPESLWNWLSNWESSTGGQVMAIPHNGNMSNGWMFLDKRYDGSPMTSDWAEARARWEVLYEIFQYKGSGETHPMLSPLDEFANYEIWDKSDLAGNAKPEGALAFEYARQALLRGIQSQPSLGGTNPYKLGFVSGSDTHTGLASGGEENNFWGKFPASEPGAERWGQVYRKEERGVRKNWTLSAAGITGVWASANTREAIWDAMKRRETYASSGPRIKLRFFGGFDFSSDDASGDIATVGYQRGVPMGGDLHAAAGASAPTFLIHALKDPDGANLDRLQLVKGWVDAAGNTHEKVVDVSWSDGRQLGADGKLPGVGSSVDLTTAEYSNSIGVAELRGSFTDAEFDPGQRAFYYARAIEIPTPRWTAYDAARFKVQMDADVRMTVTERAVSSPIWYTP